MSTNTKKNDDAAGQPAAVSTLGAGAWVWHFVLFMTFYNGLKYPIFLKSTPEHPYAISSILGGTILATTPRWFILVHIPVMVYSNVVASALALGWIRSNRSLFYISCVVAEVLNCALLTPGGVHDRLGITPPGQATLLNYGAAIPTVILLLVSLAANTKTEKGKKWQYFSYAYAFKCLLIFFGEMGALVSLKFF